MSSSMKISGSEDGFTLIEIIVTIILGSILAALMFQFMGSALTGSSGPVEIVRDSSDMEALMEEIISAYVKEINDTSVDPTDALATIVTNYGSHSNVTLTYITFDASGTEQTSGTATNTLKVVVQSAGHSLVTLLTNSRTRTDDPVSKF